MVGASNPFTFKVIIVIFRTFHPKGEEYTFFSSAHGTFFRIYHILGHKSSLSKFKKIEIVSRIFSDHNGMRLDMNYRKKKLQKNTKTPNSWRLNNPLLNNEEVTEKIRREIKRFLETNDNENMMTQSLWDSVRAVLRGRFIVICTPFRLEMRADSLSSNEEVSHLSKSTSRGVFP